MAPVRLPYCPTSSQFSTQQLLQFPQTNPLSSLPKAPQFTTNPFPHLSILSLSTSSFPLSHILPLKTHKPSNPFIFSASSSSTQSQATIETPELTESTQPHLSEGEDEEAEVDEATQTKVLAQNMPWTSTVDDVRSLFEKYGTVVDIELSIYNKKRATNRGLAFVTMGSHEEALSALNNLQSYEFEGRILKLDWAKPKEKTNPVAQKPKPAPIHNLFVANLPYQARAKDLKEFFNSENGNAVSADVIFHEKPRRSAGYGFVSFYTKQEAEAALSAFQGKLFMGRRIRVANSKRFLRQGTKATILLESASTTLNPNTERSEEADAA
ncbi:28 kDa ribonucleoprotein, chloroplastic [Rhododendron vialii]|uniref:28 kDa ribonucleoprotein, chloroplastic n=1 Tax=Rhododendron vialii TaxID=182163 RepID=UPI00265F29A4|nr:28 kDa ribonucleoprotein, chloroplastic [Rhododendron vialii]XP_058221335.1 28 kDa ribonucleoprotein, chloroplastic [Rhododendron vialii]XP_058221336.1 28 kDa ribonucleoprotein, chloroplastic [Rhododendron vialii]XP_058221337.1 28 kDa ribonucleoprotein, chloroplastic [Rhododendron vialii]